MLKIDFTEPSDIHYVAAERIGSFKGNGPRPSRRTISVDVTKIFDADSELRDNSLAVLDLFGAQVGRFLEVLIMKSFRRHVISDSVLYAFRDRLVNDYQAVMNELLANAVRQKTKAQRNAAAAAGVPVLAQGKQSKIKPIILAGLPPKLWKAALDRAADILLRYWRLVQTNALDEIENMSEWKTPESHETDVKAAVISATASPSAKAADAATGKAPVDGSPNADAPKTDRSAVAAQPVFAPVAAVPAPAKRTSGKRTSSKKKPVTPFTAAERSYIREILDDLTEGFFDVLDGKAPEPVRIDSAGIKTRRKICKIIRDAVDKVKGRAPVHGDSRSVVYEESCYSAIYDIARKKTELRFMSLQKGERLSVIVSGELPVRDKILPVGAKTPVQLKNRQKPAIQLIHDVGYWGFHFAVPVCWKTHEVPTEKPDKTLFRMTGYQAVLAAGCLPNPALIQSDWFDQNSYCVLFDEKRKVTRITFLPDDPANAFSVELPPRCKPAEEGVLLKNGEIKSVKPRKPLVHLVRIGPAGGPVVEFRSPLKPRKNSKTLSNFYRAYLCHVLSHEGSSFCTPGSRIGFEAFDGQSYTAVYEKDNDVTELKLRRRGGLPDKIVRLQGQLPVREYLDDGKGVRTLCTHTKKPTVYCMETDKKLTVELMLPAQLPASVAAAFSKPKAKASAAEETAEDPVTFTMRKITFWFASRHPRKPDELDVFSEFYSGTPARKKGLKKTEWPVVCAMTDDRTRATELLCPVTVPILADSASLKMRKAASVLFKSALPAGPDLPLSARKVFAELISASSAGKMFSTGYYKPNEYLAVYNTTEDRTDVLVFPEDPERAGFSFTFKGQGGIIDCEVNGNGGSIDIKEKVKPLIRLDRTEHDAGTGRRVLTVRLVTQHPAKLQLGFSADASVADPNVIRVTALDIGFMEFAYDNFGNRFGEKLGKALIRYVSWITQKMKRRNRLYALTRGIFAPEEGVQSGSAEFQLLFGEFDNKRAVNIRKNNLGSEGFNTRKKKFLSEIKRIINEAINMIFKYHAGNAIVLEDFGERSFFDNSRLNKEWRRRLSTWVRGIIKERLEFKAAMAGVRLIYVPSAYSSQVCPVCGHVCRSNRHGDAFKCTCCGYEAHADIKAAEALLMRVSDPRFSRRSKLGWIRSVHRKDHDRWKRYHNAPAVKAAEDVVARAVAKEAAERNAKLTLLLDMLKDQSYACTRPAASLKAVYRVNQHSL